MVPLFDVSCVSGVAGSLATVLHDAVMNPAEGWCGSF